MGLDFLRDKRAIHISNYGRAIEDAQRGMGVRAERSQELISESPIKSNGTLASILQATPNEELDKLELLITVSYRVHGQVTPQQSSKAAMPKTFVRLENWLGFVPSPTLRKQVTKMLADQQVYVQELRAHGRNGAARWQEICTHLLWMLYVGKSVLKLGRELQGKARS